LVYESTQWRLSVHQLLYQGQQRRSHPPEGVIREATA
jgi:hypothetical protein